ncbi:MAG: hypothetical protein AAF692_04945 [Pseudomonadota bacterium]
MVRAVLLLLAALWPALMAAPTHAQARLSPIEFLVDLTRDFNAGELDNYTQRFAYPHSRVIGTRFVIVEAPDGARRRHAAARESGWAYSRINAIEALSETANFALVRVNFSRISGAGNVMSTFDAFYTVARGEVGWKVLQLAVAGQGAPRE